MTDSRLFQPLKLGNLQLRSRIAMAPLTRFRASDEHVPLPMVADYYSQRGSSPGTLLITEGTYISHQAGGYPNVPGIYNQDQIDSWKRVTEAVHKKGSFIYLQLWALGRTANGPTAEREGITIKSSSALPLDSTSPEPKEMTVTEIKETIEAYAQAARNSIAAGFDGVEIHGANGYLIDQFISDRVNQRTDEYGGSIDKRSRFAFEVVKAVVDAVGAERTGIRLSPFSDFQGVRMADPIPQYTDLISKLNQFDLSYVHLVSSRISGNADVESTDSLNSLIDLYHGPVLVAGGFRPDSAKRLVDDEHPNKDVVVVFGRYFISTPDLIYRLKEGIRFNDYNRMTFYALDLYGGTWARMEKLEEGYTDYPFSEQFLAKAAA